MKIFVTGGSGFIGKRFVRRLRDTEHEILCLVRETTDVRALQDAGISLTRGDVTDKDSLLRGMRGCDCVVNLANLFEFWVPDRRAYQEVNVNGTRNVMEAAIATGISKIVHVSTAAVFGNAEWPVTEASEMGPVCLSEYARSKRDGDAVVWDLYDQEQLPVLMVCPGAVIGPDDPKAAGRYFRSVISARCRLRFSPAVCSRGWMWRTWRRGFSRRWKREGTSASATFSLPSPKRRRDQQNVV